LVSLIYLYKSRLFVPIYVPASLFHNRTARPISTKYCSNLPTNSRKVLNTSMTPPSQPHDPRVPQALKPKTDHSRKKFA